MTDHLPNNDVPGSDRVVKTITVDTAVDRIGFGRFQYRVLFATGTCFMADSVQVMLLTILTRKLQRKWDFEDSIGSVITSCLFAGATVGTLILGPLGDRVGRKPILLISSTIISIFGFLIALSTNYMMLFPIIFFVGFGIGGLTVPFDILAEFLTTDTRGSFLLYIKYFWTAGSMAIPIIAYITLEVFFSWRLLAGVCVIPCLLSLFCGYLYVPESPRWLVARGHKEEALRVLKMAAEENGVDTAVAFPDGVVLQDESVEHGEFSELLSPRWRRTVLTLGVLWATYCFTFYGGIQTVTRIFDNTDDPETLDFDYAAIFVSSTAELLGTFSAIQLIDSIGRVNTLRGVFLTSGISLFLLCLTDEKVPRFFSICFAIVGRASGMAAACVTWIVTAELLSTEILSTGHSAVNAVARTGAFFSPYLVNGENPIWLVGTVLLTVNIISFTAASLLIETKGVELGKAVLIEEARSQELEEHKQQELISNYRRMKENEGTLA